MADPRGDVEHIRRLDGEVWTVEVGESKQTWKVHQNLLCKHSEFFRSAVKQEWNNDQAKLIRLPDDDADVFQVYAQWLYQGRIFVQNRKQSRQISEQSHRLLKCYILGEKIQDVIFQNTVMDSILSCVRETDEDGNRRCPTDADLVYEGTPEASPLRMLIVDMFVYYGNEEWIGSQTNVEFLLDLTRKVLEKRVAPSGQSPLYKSDGSIYHKPARELVEETAKPATDS